MWVPSHTGIAENERANKYADLKFFALWQFFEIHPLFELL